MDAFAEVFEGLRRDVFRVACRLVGEDDANDVVMEAFLKSWQALPRFRGGSSLKTWLFRITYNCAVDTLRARQRAHTIRLADLQPGNEEEEPEIKDERQKPPDQLAADAETAVQVNRALEQLPAEHRTALLLRFADGMTYAEIASATGVSIGTVMSRLFNGKLKLKKVLRTMQL